MLQRNLMAILILTAIVSGISGSHGGSTFRSTPSGTTMNPKQQTRRTPTVVQSRHQAIIGLVAASWKNDISVENRERWRLYAGTIPRPNVFAIKRTGSGYNAFLGTNALRIIAGLSIKPGPPPTPGPGLVSGLDMAFVTPADSTSNITFGEDAFPLWDKSVFSDALIISVTHQQPQSARSRRMAFLPLTTIVRGTVGIPVFPHVATYPRGILHNPNRIFIRVRRGHPNGAVAAPEIADKTVGP